MRSYDSPASGTCTRALACLSHRSRITDDNVIRDSEDARRADLVKLSSTRGTESAKWTRPRQVRRWIKKREDSVNATIKRFFRRKKNTNATEQGIQLVHDELIFFFTDFIDPSTAHRVNEPVFHYGKLMGKNRYRDLPSTCLGLFPGCACLKKKKRKKDFISSPAAYNFAPRRPAKLSGKSFVALRARFVRRNSRKNARNLHLHFCAKWSLLRCRNGVAKRRDFAKIRRQMRQNA